jgi:hypothetical protein
MLSTMFWIATGLLHHFYPWSWFFWGTCAIVIPTLFFTEIRTAGNYMSEVISPEEAQRAQIAHGMQAVGTLLNPRMSNTLALAAAIATPRASMAGFIELFLIGPRLILNATRTARLMSRLRGNDIHRTALLLHQLRIANVGIDLQRLLQNRETPADLELPLAYLVFYDWAGVAANLQSMDPHQRQKRPGQHLSNHHYPAIRLTPIEPRL